MKLALQKIDADDEVGNEGSLCETGQTVLVVGGGEPWTHELPGLSLASLLVPLFSPVVLLPQLLPD